MEGKRHEIRSKSDSICLLIGIDGVSHQALLENISLGGALVRIDNKDSKKLHVGEMCGLMFHDSHNMNPDRHTGKIVRIDSDGIGVSFQNQDFRHLKKKK
jgi:hypothetical protein